MFYAHFISWLGYLDKEDRLLSLIDEGYFEDVQEKVTAKSLMNDGKNPLLLAIKVSQVEIRTYRGARMAQW